MKFYPSIKGRALTSHNTMPCTAQIREVGQEAWLDPNRHSPVITFNDWQSNMTTKVSTFKTLTTCRLERYIRAYCVWASSSKRILLFLISFSDTLACKSERKSRINGGIASLFHFPSSLFATDPQQKTLLYVRSAFWSFQLISSVSFFSLFNFPSVHLLLNAPSNEVWNMWAGCRLDVTQISNLANLLSFVHFGAKIGFHTI